MGSVDAVAYAGSQGHSLPPHQHQAGGRGNAEFKPACTKASWPTYQGLMCDKPLTTSAQATPLSTWRCLQDSAGRGAPYPGHCGQGLVPRKGCEGGVSATAEAPLAG